MSDQEPGVDQILRSWADQARTGHEGTAVELARFTPARSRTRWAMAAAAITVALLAVGLAVGFDGGPHRSHHTPRPNLALSDPATVLHDGDLVEATGTVVSSPAGRVQFCNDRISYELGPANSPRPDPVCPKDPNTVRVIGTDLATLADRKVSNGTTQGRAELIGVYRAGTLRVQHQSAPGDRLLRRSSSLPCAGQRLASLPAALRDRFYSGSDTIIAAYRRAHPGAIVDFGLLRPNATDGITYVLTASDPSAVRRALAPAYGKTLCVVRSRYTAAQVKAGSRLMDSSSATRRAGLSYGFQGFGPDGQEQIELDVAFVTPALAALAAAQPTGLVELTPWLRPLTSRSANPTSAAVTTSPPTPSTASTHRSAPSFRYLGPVTGTERAAGDELLLQPPGTATARLTPGQAFRTWCAAHGGGCDRETITAEMRLAILTTPTSGPSRPDGSLIRPGVDHVLSYVLQWHQVACRNDGGGPRLTTPASLPSRAAPTAPAARCTETAPISATTGAALAGEYVDG